VTASDQWQSLVADAAHTRRIRFVNASVNGMRHGPDRLIREERDFDQSACATRAVSRMRVGRPWLIREICVYRAEWKFPFSHSSVAAGKF
jgi:hypothetical protein